MPLNEEQNFNQTQLELIQSSSVQYTFPSNVGDYVNLNIYDESNIHRNELKSQIYSITAEGSESFIPGDFKYITDATNTVRIKPSDILNELGYPTDNYGIDFNFLRDIFFDVVPSLDLQVETKPKFFISQISPSRKEIRLLARQLHPDWIITEANPSIPDGTPIFNDYPLNSNFQNLFKTKVGTLDNSDGYPRYDFKYLLNVGMGRLPVINNYAFDNISDSDYSSLIVKLNEPLPEGLTSNSFISIERELINTQFLSLYYESDITTVIVGDGLVPDTEIELDLINNQSDTYENYDQLVNSTSDTSFQNIISHISSSDKNLNINFNKFKNHTFFGSAKSKLKNFKDKIGKIQNNFYELSSSLGLQSAVAIDGDLSYIKTRRKELFNNVNSVVTSFTAYERFLYYDAQNSSTSSAPGIGQNLTNSVPVTDSSDELTTLSPHDGFNVVYKHKSKDANTVDLFSGKYKVQEAPFFNYSGSVYLSFLIKGNKEINSGSGYSNTSWDSGGTSGKLKWHNRNHDLHDPLIPEGAFGGSRILNPTITGSKWQRVIFVASQSYWQPIGSTEIDANFDFTNSGAGVDWQLLSGSNITGSGAILTPEGYDTYPDQLSSEYEFTGSVMPMGELFRINYDSTLTETTSSFITDVKITLNNPQYAYPFDYTYQTGSAQWSSWYDAILSSSMEFDTNNIHSLKNNLPQYINENTDFGELHTFVHMIGEHFDLIRNYIDNYNNISTINYNQLDSVPSEILPSIIKSFGWDAINPFDTELDGWFSSAQVGSSKKIVAEQTYRKILNNLLYIYKTKGTEKSIRALLNCYGYPADFLPIRMYGGNNEELEGELVLLGGVHQSPRVVTFDAEKSGVGNLIGNQSYELIKDNHYSLNLKAVAQSTASSATTLGIPWWKDGAKGDGLEFVFASKPGNNVQNLLVSSGSESRNLWKLEMAGSGAKNGKLKFYLANNTTGSVISPSNSEVMSTKETTLRDGNLWNVYLSRNTTTASNALTQSYDLYAALQDGDKIPTVVSASMRISGSGNIAAFTGTGSFSGSTDTLGSKNLIVGNNFSGSISEIRMWSGSLSASAFKMHTLDKHSVRGNSLSDSQNKLIYRFRLNENAASESALTFTDSSNSDVVKDFSYTNGLIGSNFYYNKRIIDFIRYGLRSDPQSVTNNQRVNIDDNQYFFKHDLSPDRPSLLDVSTDGSKRKTTNKIDISVSPADAINKKILNEIGGFDITHKFANPSQQIIGTGSKYPKLESLRNSILKNVVIDQNKFVRAYKNVFNNSIVNNIKKILPASTILNSVGVVIKQDLLDRIKIQTGPSKLKRELYQPISCSIDDIIKLDKSSILTPLEGKTSGSNINVTSEINYTKDGLINVMTSSYSVSSNLATIYDSNINMTNMITSSISFGSLEDTIDIDQITLSGSFGDILNSDITIFSSSLIGNHLKSYEFAINPADNILFNSSILNATTGSSINMFGSNVQISQSLNNNIFEGIYSVMTGSFFVTSEILSPTNSTLDIFPNELTSNVLFPIDSNIIHVASSSMSVSGSYLSPSMGTIAAVNSIYTISSAFENIYSNNSSIISESLVTTGKLNTSYDTSILITSTSFVTSDVLFPIDSNKVYVASSSLLLSASYQSSLLGTIDSFQNLASSSSILNQIQSNIVNMGESIPLSPSILSPRNMDFKMYDIYKITGSVLNPSTSSVSLFDLNQKISGKEYLPGYGYINHGKGLNDVHYIHHLAPGADNDYNTYKYDTNYVTFSVGDVELQSGSFPLLTGSLQNSTLDSDATSSTELFTSQHKQIDFENIHSFKNRKIISSSTIYKSYVNGGDGLQYGTPVGRTTYFSSSADGTIYYPINHEINYHTVKQQLHNLYYTKQDKLVTIVDRTTGELKPNQELGMGQFPNGVDIFPTASVYTVNITGTDVTRLKVERLNRKKK